MSVMTDVPPEIADTIIATIIYFAATSILVERFLNKIAAKKKAKQAANGEKVDPITPVAPIIDTNVKNTEAQNQDSVGLLPPQDASDDTKGDE